MEYAPQRKTEELTSAYACVARIDVGTNFSDSLPIFLLYFEFSFVFSCVLTNLKVLNEITDCSSILRFSVMCLLVRLHIMSYPNLNGSYIVY